MELANHLLETCRGLLARLEALPGGCVLTPDECFDLFSYLGELRFHGWTIHLTRDQAREISASAKDLQSRLARELRTKRTELVTRLEAGMLAMLLRVEGAAGETRSHLGTGGLGTFLTFDEFNHDLLSRLDRIGSALELLKDVGVALSPPIAGKVEDLDTVLRRLLPQAFRGFREADDLASIDSKLYPLSFWWRRLE